MHVIAASGMNVTFVAGGLLFVLSRLLKRQLALFVGILGVLYYSFLAGFEPSIIRATIMGVIAFSASILGRQNIALVALFITAYLMLLFSPGLLVNIGFQLSFLATLGILVIKPIIPFGKNVFLADDIGTTLSAQIATIPVIFSVFGKYGILSILVNALVLWTIPLLMLFGSIAIIFDILFLPVGKLILIVIIPILYYFEAVVNYFGRFNLSLNLENIPVTVWLGYYMLLIALILQRRKRLAKSAKS
jgi:competence protein ComEC